jgi:hypothetical protein
MPSSAHFVSRYQFRLTGYLARLRVEPVRRGRRNDFSGTSVLCSEAEEIFYAKEAPFSKTVGSGGSSIRSGDGGASHFLCSDWRCELAPRRSSSLERRSGTLNLPQSITLARSFTMIPVAPSGAVVLWQSRSGAASRRCSPSQLTKEEFADRTELNCNWRPCEPSELILEGP